MFVYLNILGEFINVSQLTCVINPRLHLEDIHVLINGTRHATRVTRALGEIHRLLRCRQPFIFIIYIFVELLLCYRYTLGAEKLKDNGTHSLSGNNTKSRRTTGYPSPKILLHNGCVVP